MTFKSFHTVVDIPKFKWKTAYSKKNMFLGSCFTESIGNQMEILKYDADINPFGIIYNPVSVANGLKALLYDPKFSESDLVQNNGLWHSYHFHGRFSKPDKEETVQGINMRIKDSGEYLKKADFLFLTFGTAWIYQLKNTKQTVANCHKFPAKDFGRVRLSTSEIVKEYISLLDQIWDLNPNLKIVFTVSPIRHWKDGAMENQRSKAILLLATEQIIQHFGNKKCAYFPSYEIVMDELRDYRFYAEDMIHLSDMAVEHIWQIFEKALISEDGFGIAKQVLKIKKAMNHRPINNFTKERLEFLNNYLNKTKTLETKNPNLNFNLEKDYFTKEINKIESVIG